MAPGHQQPAHYTPATRSPESCGRWRGCDVFHLRNRPVCVRCAGMADTFQVVDPDTGAVYTATRLQFERLHAPKGRTIQGADAPAKPRTKKSNRKADAPTPDTED